MFIYDEWLISLSCIYWAVIWELYARTRERERKEKINYLKYKTFRLHVHICLLIIHMISKKLWPMTLMINISFYIIFLYICSVLLNSIKCSTYICWYFYSLYIIILKIFVKFTNFTDSFLQAIGFTRNLRYLRMIVYLTIRIELQLHKFLRVLWEQVRILPRFYLELQHKWQKAVTHVRHLLIINVQ